MSVWGHIKPEELRTMNGFSDHRNVYDLQRIAAIKKIDQEIAVDEQYQGDPFLKLVECGEQYYVFNEAALIDQQEQTYRSFEMDLRLKMADSFIEAEWPW